MENHGARIQKSLQDLPEGGLSALTRLMSIASVAAAMIVVLYAVLTIILGTMSLMSGPWSWTIGDKTPGTPVTVAQMTVTQVTASPPVENQLNKTCPQLKTATGAGISKCISTPTPRAGDIAAVHRPKPTFGNGFKAAIRPAFWSVPVFLLAMGLVEAARCLNGLAAARYFNADTLTHLRNFAIAGLLYVVLTPCMPAIATGFCHIVTWFDTLIVRIWPPHEPYAFTIPTSFDGNAVVGGVTTFSGFLIILYAFTLAIIAAVMARASAIVDDHAEII